MLLLPPLLLFIIPGSSDLSAVITGPGEVSGPERGSLTVQCRYDPGWETYLKYWCRGAEFRICRILVGTTGSELEVKEDRVSIRDNQTSRVFTVTMENLTREDADTYWCGIERIVADPNVQVKVTVGPGSAAVITGPREARGPERGWLTVWCHYDPGREPYVKYWCRGADFRNCTVLVRTTGSELEVKEDRVSIRDNQTTHTFTVTMEKLRREDADAYWCGIERTGADPGAPVKVTVGPGSPAVITGPGEARGPEQGSMTVQCRYDPGWETHVKYWCRGADFRICRILVRTTGSEQEVKKDHLSIRDNQTSRMFTVTMEKLRREDADTYWCGIERTGADPGAPVKVAVGPATTTVSTTIPTPTTFTAPVATEVPTSSRNMSSLHPEGRSLLSSVHFLLLVFLKLPVFLSMLGAVLWVNRSQRGPAGGGPPRSENQ
ncbi:CMRF35-like molecule 1 isoform X2 [Phyllostomus hastatus]|uniref:CMRF35-like molecule 1 isoform X2 n=1 Tax=Phyllostomus hastatus TaxID=9423 RepID=UPI001E68522B|nr:CMRF35-like molecule 1 isoform X2 [Phyllostomus hastatus]